MATDKLYAHKPYKINPRLKAMLEKNMGKQINLMNHQIDNLLRKVYSGKYESLSNPLTDTDKEKLLMSMKFGIMRLLEIVESV